MKKLLILSLQYNSNISQKALFKTKFKSFSFCLRMTLIKSLICSLLYLWFFKFCRNFFYHDFHDDWNLEKKKSFLFLFFLILKFYDDYFYFQYTKKHLHSEIPVTWTCFLLKKNANQSKMPELFIVLADVPFLNTKSFNSSTG